MLEARQSDLGIHRSDNCLTRAVTPKARRKTVRVFEDVRAKQVLTEARFARGTEVHGFTRGQFSFIDLIEAILSHTGPADVVVSTWAASLTDLGRLALFCDDGRIGRARFLLDGAFESYNKPSAMALREKFGDENIRVVPNHAKFVMIGNADWSVTVQTSMNLKQNRRIEQFTIIEDADFYAGYGELVADIWGIQPPGAGFGEGGYHRSVMTLASLFERKAGVFGEIEIDAFGGFGVPTLDDFAAPIL
jgi:hypothetical protein